MSNSSTEAGTGAPTGGGNGQGQEPPANGQQGQESGGQQQQETGNGSGEQIDYSTIQDPALRGHLERLDKAAREARADAARYRTERNAERDKVTEFQRQNETAEQKAQREQQEREQQAQTDKAERQALEQENRRLRNATAVQAAAVAAKAFNPARVMEMIQDQVTLDSDGKPNNLDDLLKELRKTDPYMFKRASTDAGNGGGEEDRNQRDDHPNSMLRRALGKG